MINMVTLTVGSRSLLLNWSALLGQKTDVSIIHVVARSDLLQVESPSFWVTNTFGLYYTRQTRHIEQAVSALLGGLREWQTSGCAC